MQLEENGNVIKSIKFNKKTVKITFENESISISKEAYEEIYLFVGKQLSEEEIQKLRKITDFTNQLTYAKKLVAKRRMSRQELKTKLYAHKAKTPQISIIFQKLEELNLLSDDDLVREIIEIENLNGYGKLHIIQKLNYKGLASEHIEFEYSKELRKAEIHIQKLSKKYSNHSYRSKTNRIYSSLKILGFEDSVIEEVTSRYLKKDESKEIDNLVKDMKIAFLRYENIEDNKMLKDKVIKSLLSKGYEINDISKQMEEFINENDSWISWWR